jgi:hypothetical protein
LAEWFKHHKVTLQDIARQQNWALDVPRELPEFTTLQCIEISKYASPVRMVDLGLTLRSMRTIYKLPYTAMPMMPYDAHAWLEMGFDMQTHGREMTDEEFISTFKTSKRNAFHIFQHAAKQPLQAKP